MTITEAIEILKTGDEAALRELEMPWMESTFDVVAVFDALTEREHDYGTCVYAMSIAAEAAYNFMAKRLDATGFQASSADLDIVRRTRGLKGPFAIIDANDLLYPQYDLQGKVAEYVEKWQPWAKDEAQKLLDKNKDAHPNVQAHWERLAA